jgi:hypothetical protein
MTSRSGKTNPFAPIGANGRRDQRDLLLDRGAGRGRGAIWGMRFIMRKTEEIPESAEGVEETSLRAAGDGDGGRSRRRAFRRRDRYKVAVRVTDNLNPWGAANAEDAATGNRHRATRQRHRMGWVAIGDGDGASLVGCHRQSGRRIRYV